jgi:hypothetical protein
VYQPTAAGAEAGRTPAHLVGSWEDNALCPRAQGVNWPVRRLPRRRVLGWLSPLGLAPGTRAPCHLAGAVRAGWPRPGSRRTSTSGPPHDEHGQRPFIERSPVRSGSALTDPAYCERRRPGAGDLHPTGLVVHEPVEKRPSGTTRRPRPGRRQSGKHTALRGREESSLIGCVSPIPSRNSAALSRTVRSLRFCPSGINSPGPARPTGRVFIPRCADTAGHDWFHIGPRTIRSLSVFAMPCLPDYRADFDVRARPCLLALRSGSPPPAPLTPALLSGWKSPHRRWLGRNSQI